MTTQSTSHLLSSLSTEGRAAVIARTARETRMEYLARGTGRREEEHGVTPCWTCGALVLRGYTDDNWDASA